MKIVVCVKQVPDTSEVRIDQNTGTMIREGVKSIINPDDLGGLETALRIKDINQAEVIALSMGPMQADSALRECLAMGADRAILLTDRVFAGADTWAASLLLSKAIQLIEPDLIITGRQAIDGDTAQVGPQIAEHLGIPSVAYINEVILEDDHSLVVKRMFETGYHRIRVKTPCLLTVLKEINEPRYMRVSRIFNAYKEGAVEVWDNTRLAMDPEELGLKGSPTKVKKSYTKGVKTAGKVFEVEPEEAAKIIVQKLKESYIL